MSDRDRFDLSGAELLGRIVFHPDHAQIGPLLETISHLRQALEYLEFRYQQAVRTAPTSIEDGRDYETERERPAAPAKRAPRKAAGQGRGRPRKANGTEPPPADPPLFPPSEPTQEHAA